MSKQCFKERKFSSESADIISQADAIISEYQAAGYRMTLRQLYYQFVSKNISLGDYGDYTEMSDNWTKGEATLTPEMVKVLVDGKGLQVNHDCDVRNCCNPRHLHTGTQKQNREEAVARGRTAKGDRQGLRLHPERAPKGERNGSAKLKSDQVIQIRRSQLTDRSLADKYGVSEGAIRFVRIRETWKHI